MADIFENPMGLMGFEFIELASPTPGVLEPVFQILGFTKVATHRSKDVHLYRQGGINLILNNEPKSIASYFAAEHGPSVCGMAFRVRNAHEAYARALELGAQPVEIETGPMELRVIEHAVADLEKITGQKPVVTFARKSIAGFKVREGWPIGVKVTLRSDKMYEFLDRLLAISLPRVRDFRGLNAKSFDGRGNYSMGVKEQIIFPEIDYDKIDALRGLDITLTTTARSDDEGRALLRAFKFPFRN